MKVHSFKTCAFSAHCIDPCNKASKEWRIKHIAEMQPQHPGHDFGKADTCSKLGRCAMTPCSARCYAYRCRECHVWMDRDEYGEGNFKEYCFASMLASAENGNDEVAHE